MALKKALEEIGQVFLSIRINNHNCFNVFTNQIAVLVRYRLTEDMSTIEGEIDIDKKGGHGPQDLSLDKRKEKKLLDHLRKKVFDKISEESHSPTFRKFWFEFKADQKSPGIAQTTSETKVKVAGNIGTEAQEGSIDDEDFTMTTEK